MNFGKTMFTQLMNLMPWTGFAVATYALIAIVKKELHLDASLYQLLQILSVSVFEKIELRRAFAKGEIRIHEDASSKQLPLFDF